MLVRGTNSGTLPSRNCQDHTTFNVASTLSKSLSNVLEVFAIIKSHSVYNVYIYIYTHTLYYYLYIHYIYKSFLVQCAGVYTIQYILFATEMGGDRSSPSSSPSSTGHMHCAFK